MEVKLMSKNSLNVLGKKLAEKTGLSQQEAELFIKKMFDVVNEGLQDDKQVKVKWLGTFKVTSVKDRESVDVNTGERIVIDGRDKISFTPDNILKEIVNKPFAQFETVVVNDGVEFDEIDKKFEAEEQMNENQQVKESKEQMVENQQTAEAEKPLNANLQVAEAEAEASDVIDFLDESDTSAVTDKPEILSVSNEVVVIGDSETSNAASSQTSDEASFQISNEAFPEIITETIVQNSVDEMNPAVNEPEEVQKEQEQVQAPEVQLKEDAQNEPEVQDKVNVQNEPEVQIKENAQNELEIQDMKDVLEEQKTRNEPESQNELKTQNEPEESVQDESEADAEIETESYDTFESTKKGIVIPRYLVIVACFLMVALIGGIGWFAFNYGKMAAQRDHLALQLDSYQQDANKPKAASAPPSQEEIMRKKAIEDSIRMVKASEAVKMAEAEGKQIDENASLDVDKNKSEAGTKKQLETQKQAAEAKKHAEDMKAAAAKKQAENASAKAASKYNQDVRVRTGAYRIVGVAEVVTAREGQTIEAISKRYFGPGMECYVEALNGSGKLKAGQKVKIPKLELKKKK